MEFYEEAMSLSCDLTTKHVSPDMWKMLEVGVQLYIFFSVFLIGLSNAMQCHISNPMQCLISCR